MTPPSFLDTWILSALAVVSIVACIGTAATLRRGVSGDAPTTKIPELELTIWSLTPAFIVAALFMMVLGVSGNG